MLYPLKFHPILKEKIWGGNKIAKALGLSSSELNKNIGENFVLSGLASDTSVVLEGALQGKDLCELIDLFKGSLVGNKVYEKYGNQFPLLLKYIDANDDLSVQVHPNDEKALELHNSFGKTEMWYVLEAEEDAGLISGFSYKTTASDFSLKHSQNELMDLMQLVKTKHGDAFFIPAGKVHSIGKGNLIAEIQQTSDVTYRIYDFDRKDEAGNGRELHHEQAMEVLDFMDDDSGKVDYTVHKNETVNIVDCNYFTTNVISIDNVVTKNYSNLDSFVILMNVDGSCEIEADGYTTNIDKMEVVLIPSTLKNITLKSKKQCKLLEVYVS